MAKLSKRVQALRAKVDRNKLYPVTDALSLVKELSTAKFDESVDVSINLGVDAKKSDQVVRGAVVLPAGTGNGEVLITPDILRNAIVDADRRIVDFRLVQTGADTLELSLLTALPDTAAEAARQAVEATVHRAGGVATAVLLRVPAFPVSALKLRRIERRWTP